MWFFYKQREGLLTLCWRKLNNSSPIPPSPPHPTLAPCPNSYWGNPESHAFDTCITPGGNAFAQHTRQLILSMSSALGGRMEQRFDLIGDEKVSHSGPVGREEGYRGSVWHMQGQMHRALIYLSDSRLSQWASRTATSMGVQNKHTLIGQLITGTNAGGRTLREGHFDCSRAFVVIVRACVSVSWYMCVCVKSWCWTRANVGQHILRALGRLDIVGQSVALVHTSTTSRHSQETERQPSGRDTASIRRVSAAPVSGSVRTWLHLSLCLIPLQPVPNVVPMSARSEQH